jgi:hypothetical protein
LLIISFQYYQINAHTHVPSIQIESDEPASLREVLIQEGKREDGERWTERKKTEMGGGRGRDAEEREGEGGRGRWEGVKGEEKRGKEEEGRREKRGRALRVVAVTDHFDLVNGNIERGERGRERRLTLLGR